MAKKRKAVIYRDLESDTVEVYSNLKKVYEKYQKHIYIAYSSFTKEIQQMGEYNCRGIIIKKMEIE